MKLKSNIPFGRTGLLIPPVIYGTSYLGNLYKALPYQEKLALIKKWFEYTEKPVVIDSAGKYGAGLSLEILGKGLSELNIKSEDVIISNKLGWYRTPLESDEPTFEPGAWIDIEHDAVQKFGYDDIINCFEQGNELLGKNYKAGLVSVHDPDEYLAASYNQEDREKRIKEILDSYKALFDLKADGKVIAIGIGSKDWLVIKELYEHVKFDWVMFANSFTIYHHPDELLTFMDHLQLDGVGIINSAVFHGGFLTGGTSFDYKMVEENSVMGEIIYKWRRRFFTICESYNVQPADACIQFGLSHSGINAIALNTSKLNKISHNASVLQNDIPDEFWKALKEAGLIENKYTYL